MRPILRLVSAAALLAGLSAMPLWAADKSAAPEGAGVTRRQMEERPFGGPPPKMRSTKRTSKKCKTSKKTCELKKEDTVGSKCSCPGTDTAQGTIVE
jgi:hypothetical protein